MLHVYTTTKRNSFSLNYESLNPKWPNSLDEDCVSDTTLQVVRKQSANCNSKMLEVELKLADCFQLLVE